MEYILTFILLILLTQFVNQKLICISFPQWNTHLISKACINMDESCMNYCLSFQEEKETYKPASIFHLFSFIWAKQVLL